MLLHFTFIKKNCLIISAKFLKDILQLVTGLQFDICYVIKTRVGLENAEITIFLIWKKKIFKSTYIMKLFVYETVKCEVTNIGFLSRDLPLNNSAITVKWKCLKSLHSSKGMYRIDSQLKKLIRLKYLILEGIYTFF